MPVVLTGSVFVLAGAQRATADIAPPSGAQVTLNSSSVAAGQVLSLEGTGCSQGSNSTIVLIAVKSPLGTTVSTTTIPVSAFNAGQWYGTVSIPAGIAPSKDYQLHASCRSQGDVFDYVAVDFSVTKALAAVVNLSTTSAAPGTSVTVSGLGCKPLTGQPAAVDLVLVDPSGNAVDASASTPQTSGAWSGSLAVPSDAGQGVYSVDSTCDKYQTSTSYLPASLYVASPSGVAPTTLAYEGATTGAAGNETTLIAALTSGGVPVSGVPVALTLGATTLSAYTGGNGIAQVQIAIPSGAPTVKVSASFGGDSGFASASTGQSTFTVQPGLAATRLSYTGAKLGESGHALSLSAKLTDSSGTAIVGRPVSFWITGQPLAVAGTTNSSGIATASATLYQGTVSVTARFDGNFDGQYASSTSKSALVTILPPFAPSAVTCSSSTLCISVGNAGQVDHSSDGGATWTEVISPTSNALTSVSCATTSACVAVGSGGVILTTTNGGSTWTLRSPATNDLVSVACPASSLCVAVGAGGVTLHSTDKGTSWTVGTSSEPTYNFDELTCPTATKCVATANDGVGDSATLASTDGGLTWSVVTASEPYLGPPGPDQLHCLTATVCLAVSDDNDPSSILRSINGGATWKAVDTFSGFTSGGWDNGTALSCSNSTDCTALIRDGNGYLLSAYSTDSGKTWSAANFLPGQAYDADVSCSSLTCVGVAATFASGSEAFTSADGGQTWSAPIQL